MSESTFTDPKVIELSKNFVNFIAHSETSHGSREVQVGREKVKLCNEYYDIPCEVHTKGYAAVGKFFQGSFGTPTTVFADPSGKEIGRAVGGLGGSELMKEMNKALAKVTGDKVPLATWSQAKQLGADGRAALEKGDLKKAVDCFTKLGKIKGFKPQADEDLKAANEAAGKLLSEALALENAEEKKKALRKLADDAKGLPAAAEAKKELDALK